MQRSIYHKKKHLLKTGEWTILEPWLAHLNTSLLQDADADSCLHIHSTTPLLSLTNRSPRHSTFTTEVILPAELEPLRSDIITVFTSSDLSNPSATCQLSGALVKCGHESGPNYICKCLNPCHIYVKVFRPIKSSQPLSLCEVNVT